VEARALATAAKTATVELAATAERAATAVTVSPVLTRFLMALDSKVETAAMAASAAPLGLVAPGTRQVRVDHQVLMETAVTAQMAAKAAQGDWVEPVAPASCRVRQDKLGLASPAWPHPISQAMTP
jgi:hypothetical protein